MKCGCWGLRGHWGCWGCRGHWGYRGSKAWKIITEDFRVTQDLEFSFILKKIIFVWIMKYHVEFCTFSVRGCWGQPMSLFWKLVDETQISKPPEPAMSHNSMKLMVLLPFIAIYFRSKHYETLCSIKIEQNKKKIHWKLSWMNKSVIWVKILFWIWLVILFAASDK